MREDLVSTNQFNAELDRVRVNCCSFESSNLLLSVSTRYKQVSTQLLEQQELAVQRMTQSLTHSFQKILENKFDEWAKNSLPGMLGDMVRAVVRYVFQR